MYDRNEQTDECELKSVVYIVISLTVAVAVVAVGFFVVRRYRRNNEQRQRLLERQHPVYTGW